MRPTLVWGSFCDVPEPSGPTELLAALAAVLRGWGNRWFVFGAQAVVAYGLPRMTADVDATVRLVPDDWLAFCAEMDRAGFESRTDDLDAFVRATRVLPFVHRASGIPLDLILAGSPLEDEFIERARPLDLGGVTVPVISVEDLLVTKILAGRAKDVDDVRGILRERAGGLDLVRVRTLLGGLERALARADLVAVLDRALAEVGPS